MTSRTAWLLRFSALLVAMILVTVALGWWGVPIVGAAFAALDGRDSTPMEASASAASGWALILLVTALAAGARPVGIIGNALGIPAIAIPLASIIFASLLAWSSAAVALFARTVVVGAPDTRAGPGATAR